MPPRIPPPPPYLYLTAFLLLFLGSLNFDFPGDCPFPEALLCLWRGPPALTFVPPAKCPLVVQGARVPRGSATGAKRRPLTASALFQMADVSSLAHSGGTHPPGQSETKSSRESHKGHKSREHREGRHRQKPSKVAAGLTVFPTSPPPPPSTMARRATTIAGGDGLVEERKRSASSENRSIGNKKPPFGGGGGHSHHHNVTMSSHKVKQQPRRNHGGKPPPSWHELSSTEKSIAMMLRCQDLDSRDLLPSATTCRNLRSDKVCNYLFEEIDTKSGRRDVKCNLQGLEDIAESCRKACGICCEDINYACEDDSNGIVDCSRQLDKCHQKKWFGVLSRFCAGSCGLCAMTACRDYDNSCRVRKSICLKQESLDYMRENCARTCGFCMIGEEAPPPEGKGSKKGGGGGKGSGKPVVVERPDGPNKKRKSDKHRLVVPECTDKVDNCSTNAHLCGSPLYGEYMIKFCTKTCLKCGEAQTSKGSKSAAPGPPIEIVIEPMPPGGHGHGKHDHHGSTGARRAQVGRKCVDLEEKVKCTKWRMEGLCKAGNDDQRRARCPKTCEICK